MANELAECWECKKEIGTTAKLCPHCGADQSKNPALMAKGCIGCLIFIAIVMLLSGVLRLIS